MNYYLCPVCFYTQMPYAPMDYNICPCCATEFGNDDVEFSYEVLREQWIINGARWFFAQPPAGWNAWEQLAKYSYGVQVKAGVDYSANRVNIWTEASSQLSFA